MLPQRCDGLSQLQELLFSLAHQFHEDVAVPSALAAKAAHDFFQLLLEPVGLARELRRPAAAPLCEALNQLESFFALYTAWWQPLELRYQELPTSYVLYIGLYP